MTDDLVYIPNFISESEETLFLKYLETSEYWSNNANGKRRRMQRRMQAYGYKYDKGDFSIGMRETTKIPDVFESLLSRLNKETDRVFNQMTVNEYLPGQGIDSHYDHKTRFGDVIAGVSLGSGCTMIFSHRDDKINLYLEPRSLYILKRTIRYDYKHKISKVFDDNVNGQKIIRKIRTSLTFRIC